MDDFYFMVIGGILLLINIGCCIHSCYSSQRSQYKSVSMTDEEAEPDGGVNNQGNIINIVRNGRKGRWITISIIAAAVIFSVCILGIGLFIHYFNKLGVDSYGQRGINDVLTNTKLVVSANDEMTFSGEFFVEETTGIYEYGFKMVAGSQTGTISFIGAHTFGDWKGFHIYRDALSDTTIKMDFIKTNDEIETVERKPNENLQEDDHKKMELAFGDILGQHFVELSIKAGAAGHIGEQSAPIMGLHTFALTTYKEYYEKWVDLDDEIEKMNSVIIGVSHTSTGTQRSLLGGSCTTDCKCNNHCYGLCGPACKCWSWLCGDCECHKYCRDHDFFCSCLAGNTYCCSISPIFLDVIAGSVKSQCDSGFWCYQGVREHDEYSCDEDCNSGGCRSNCEDRCQFGTMCCETSECSDYWGVYCA